MDITELDIMCATDIGRQLVMVAGMGLDTSVFDILEVGVKLNVWGTGLAESMADTDRADVRYLESLRGCVATGEGLAEANGRSAMAITGLRHTTVCLFESGDGYMRRMLIDTLGRIYARAVSRPFP